MPTFYDSRNQPYVIAEQLGSGGEGAVYACENAELVAKIYHETVTDEKAEKLRWMTDHQDEQLTKIAAWVADILTDAPGGRVVGFLMPSVRAKEIHELYSLKSRRVHFPRATWSFLVHTAANLARAFYILHQNLHVMGDVNHGNCVVLADGTVKLIDCDSYSIRTDERRYSCEVGVTTHLAPELQGANLRGIERENKHDDFGLAVIIFQLLFLGRHPFAGNYLGAEDKSIEDCIRELRFAYGDNARHRSVAQPPGTLPLAAASPPIARMFERAFTSENRPEPREWIEALEDLANNLEQCSLHPGHHYYKELASCPWCELEANTGLMLFPFVNSADADGAETFNVFTVESLINSFGLARDLPAAAPISDALPPPSAEVVAAKNDNRKKKLKLAAYHLAAIVFLMLTMNVVIGIFFSISITIYFIYLLNKADETFRADINDQLNNAKLAWNKLAHNWEKTALPQNLNAEVDLIRGRVAHYQTLMREAARRKISRDENVGARLVKYLRSFPIAEADIGAIDAADLNALKVWGVKTAADVDENKLATIFRLDSVAKTALLDWRGILEKEFAQTSGASETTLLRDISRRRRAVEIDIEQKLAALRSASFGVRRRQQQWTVKSKETAARLRQSESDAKIFSFNYPAIVLVLINLLVIMPTVGILFNKPEPARDYTSNDKHKVYNDNYTSGGNGSGYGPSSGDVAPPPPPMPMGIDAKNLDVPDENITDADIAELPEADRAKYANILLYQTNSMFVPTATDGDYKKIVRKLRLAVRLVDDDKRLYDKLGEALYKLKNYSESLKYFQRSLAIDSADDATKIYIGINYLNLNKSAKARDILTEVTEKSPTLQAGFFNLGLANENLKNYSTAAENFRQAVELVPGDADARYELAVCLDKSGDKTAVRAEYENLKNIDPNVAEKLRNTLNIPD